MFLLSNINSLTNQFQPYSVYQFAYSSLIRRRVGAAWDGGRGACNYQTLVSKLAAVVCPGESRLVNND